MKKLDNILDEYGLYYRSPDQFMSVEGYLETQARKATVGERYKMKFESMVLAVMMEVFNLEGKFWVRDFNTFTEKFNLKLDNQKLPSLMKNHIFLEIRKANESTEKKSKHKFYVKLDKNYYGDLNSVLEVENENHREFIETIYPEYFLKKVFNTREAEDNLEIHFETKTDDLLRKISFQNESEALALEIETMVREELNIRIAENLKQ